MFRIITGSILVIFGLWLLYAGLAEDTGAIIPGVILGIIGVVIILNKTEDDIEEINKE